MDSLTPQERSKVMSLVCSKNSRIELKVRSYLHKQGFRYCLHVKSLPGKPDIVLPKYQTVVFIQGCFWHRHQDPLCKLTRTPKSNVDFWENKFMNNVIRDKKIKTMLESQSWKVLYVWECQLQKSDEVLEKLAKDIKGCNY